MYCVFLPETVPSISMVVLVAFGVATFIVVVVGVSAVSTVVTLAPLSEILCLKVVFHHKDNIFHQPAIIVKVAGGVTSSRGDPPKSATHTTTVPLFSKMAGMIRVLH